MEAGVGQGRDAPVGLPVEVGKAGHHLPLVTVVGTEVKVAGAAVLLLVDEVVQQDVQPLHPGKVGIPDLPRQLGGALPMTGVSHQAEDPQGGTRTGGKLVPGHGRQGPLLLAEPPLQQGNALLRAHVLVHLERAVALGQLVEVRGDQLIGRQAGQHLLTGRDEAGKVAAIIVSVPEAVVVVESGSRRQGVSHGGVQSPEVVGIKGSAAIAQVVQVVADGLVGDDEPHDLAMAPTGQQTVDGAALAVEGLVGDARQGLLPQLRAGNRPGPLGPVPEVRVHAGANLQEDLRRHRQDVGRRRLHPVSLLHPTGTTGRSTS